jgi:hypothetical protein
MSKKVPITSKPKKATSPDAFVSGDPTSMKRLTIDVSEALHRKIKMQCVANGQKMADALRAILEREFKG